MGIANEKNFKIIKKLGEGGFGEVYLIEKENKLYALKKTKHALNEEEMNQYNKIISILKNINNIYVTKYYYTFTEKNSFNIIMEFSGEKNLKQFIDSHREKEQLIEEYIISYIIKQICEGIKEIHKNKLIHRDLTPDNIFIDENYRIKIGDFGISKILETNKYAKSIIGKYKYFAPEIEMGEKYNNKIDIYSFGCIIYELFTLNEYYIDKRIKEKDCQINVEVYNPEWQNLINSLLNKDYHKRPDIEQIYYFISSIIINIKDAFNFKQYFDEDCLIQNKYYNENKDKIKCQYCFKILFESLECLKCKKRYCRSCFRKKEIHKCEDIKQSLNLNLETYELFLNLKFFCKSCFEVIKYKDIDNHINKGCLNKGKFLKRINRNEYWKLSELLDTKITCLNSKLFFISQMLFFFKFIVLIVGGGVATIGRTSLIKT